MQNNNPEETFDKNLKDRFSDFHSTPEHDLFSNIQKKINPQEFDEEVARRFEHFSAMPSNQVWENIQPALPIHLRLKRHLHFLSKVAAALLIGISTLYITQFYSQNQEQIAAIIDSPVETLIATTDEQPSEDFVFSPEEELTVETNDKVRKKRRNRTPKIEDTDDFLSFILEEEDEFGDAIDIDIITESMRPVEDISVGLMTAALQPLPKTKRSLIPQNDIELRINIPLQVVEPHEVEELLEIYDNRNR